MHRTAQQSGWARHLTVVALRAQLADVKERSFPESA